MLEVVVNVSEGRDAAVLGDLAAAAGPALLDLHRDPDHHRSVLTLVGEEAPRAVAAVAVARIDLRRHAGVHPRIGAVDVVPFVALPPTPPSEAVRARDDFAAWAASTLHLPCFLYGPERSLPAIRAGAFGDLAPDVGPAVPHPTAGACAVGARPPMLAWNLWLQVDDLPLARRLARSVRGPAVRALGLPVDGGVQVSCNLIDPLVVGPAVVYDAVAAQAPVRRAELVGLAPRAVLDAVPEDRWDQLDLAVERTIEARAAAAGLG